MIDGNLHHIFSANNIPTFGDKSEGAKRRTLLIPFEAKFNDDPTFIERTFTPEFYAQHLGLFLQYAKRLKKQNYHYIFGGQSVEVKERYDEGTNSGASYIDDLLSQYIGGFDSYGYLYTDYEHWCNDGGYSMMSRQHLRLAAENRGYHGTTSREGDKHFRRYVHKDYSFVDLEPIGGTRPGLYRQINAPDDLIETPEVESGMQEFLDAIPD
jgi:phage/plasmid-associated DNA primase